MASGPAVIVKKGGFFTAVANGVFGLLITTVICAAGLGVYAIRVVNGQAGSVVSAVEGILSAAPEWMESMPPLLSDVLHDRRDPTYEQHINAKVWLDVDEWDDQTRVVFEIENDGPHTVTLMAARVVLKNDRGVPIRELTTYIATPITADTCDGEWRGPLFPNKTRSFARELSWRDRDEIKSVDIEITELRVWDAEESALARGNTDRQEP